MTDNIKTKKGDGDAMFGMSPIMRYMTLSDVVIFGSQQLLSPIFALFIIDRIEGADAAVAGVAAAIFLLSSSLAQIPVATIIDKIKGEKDDFWFMFIATLVNSLVPLLYLIIDLPFELYLVQFCLGLSAAVLYPSYMAIYTRHMNPKKAGTVWGVRFTLMDLTCAGMASIGGIIAISFGFNTLIILLSGLSFIGTILLLPIRRSLR